MTFRLSTTTSCARLRRWRGDDGGAPWLAPVLVAVARWSTDLDVIFISDVRCTAMIVDE